jgi:hypothetical protein
VGQFSSNLLNGRFDHLRHAAQQDLGGSILARLIPTRGVAILGEMLLCRAVLTYVAWRRPDCWLRGLILRHRNHGAGERAVGLSQLIQNREVIGVGDWYQVAWDMPLRPVGMVIAAARDHGRQLAGAVRRRTLPISTCLSALAPDRAMEAWYDPPIA